MSRIRLTWNNASTTIVEQRVYRSISPLDIDDMPDPLAVLPRRDREYLDSTIEDGLTYYYAVSSVLPDYSELISKEIKVEATPDGDPHWDKVVALLHFDGDLVDEKGLAWTQNGSAIVSTIDPKFGSGSLSIPGTSGYVQTLSELIAGAEGNRITVELFIKIRTLTRTGIIFDFRPPNNNGNYLAGWYTAAGGLACHINGADTPVAPAGSVTASNEWTHYAVVVDGSTLMVFVGGIMVGSFVGVKNYDASNHGRIGRSAWDSSTSFPDAAFDELRITKGVARYTENFTPPTKPFPNN